MGRINDIWFMFKLLKTSKRSHARITRLTTNHGAIDGPFFMPIATRGAVKHVAPDEMDTLGASILLSNTYHLLLQPGPAVVQKAGGLHRFIGWRGPILTDSGGFQVFSLTRFRKITSRGVSFRDPASGRLVELTPRRALEIQRQLGSDIQMVLDVCVGYPASRSAVAQAVEQTTAWAKASRNVRKGNGILRFGIIQGGTYPDLRERSCEELVALNFDGYAIGGLAVGETSEQMKKILAKIAPRLPANKPRYLMGVGKPEEIVAAVRQGIDMFDCVIPTREARHGRLYVWRYAPTLHSRHLASGRKLFYDALNVRNKKFINQNKPIDRHCPCPCCKKHTLAFLHHLFRVNEPLGARLATLHNVRFYLDLMMVIRQGIYKNFI